MKRLILVLAIISIAIMGMNSRAEAVSIGSAEVSSGATIINFDSLPSGTLVDDEFSSQGVLFSNPTPAFGGAGGIITSASGNARALAVTASIIATFSVPVYEVGVDVVFGLSPNVTLDVYDSSNALRESVTLLSDGFLGIRRTEAIAYAIIHDSSFDFEIDNFTFYNVVATPEPASLVLLGSGLMGFGILRWRRKQKEAS